MKKQLNFCLFLYVIMSTFLIEASSFQIAVPQDLIKKNATLLLLVRDEKGQQSFRKYRLGNTKTNTVRQDELEITTESSETSESFIEILPNMSTLLDISSEEAVVVYFQLDSEYQVLRVMVLKDSLLEDDPFDIVSLPIANEMEFEQFYEEMQDIDELEKLTGRLEHSDLSDLNNSSDIAWFEKYMLYVKIFTTMQYHKVRKAVSAAWWN